MPWQISHTASCQAPVDVAFAYVSDYRNVGQWLFGVSKFEPVGEQTYGLGAIFDASLHLGLPIHTRIRVSEFEEGALMAFDSVKGFKVTSIWRFTALDDATTSIDAEVDLTLPFGPAGKAMGKVIQPVLKTAITHSSKELAHHIEATARS